MPYALRPWLLRAAVALLLLPSPSAGEPIKRTRTFYDTDWVTVGVGGVGNDGTATFDVAGVSGTVHTALLYWHGIDPGNGEDIPGDGVYENATVQFAGADVVGSQLGDATTNCWGLEGSSRAYVADVTSLVAGNGTYAVANLASDTGHDCNGASLVVLYRDGTHANDRDLIFFEGNDSNVPDGFPGEDEGWHGTMEGLNYRGGRVHVELHVADGQDFSDGEPTFTSAAGSVTIPDTSELWDGLTVPTMGDSRSPAGALWDIHRFELTSALGEHGVHSIEVGGMDGDKALDCLGLVLAVIDLPFGTAPRCGDGLVFYEEACDDGNLANGDCCSSSCEFEDATTVCQTGASLCEHATCDGAGACDRMRADSCRHPAASNAAHLGIRNPSQARKRQFDFTWETGTARPEELGDPAGDTRYELCLFRTGETPEVLSQFVLNDPAGCSGSCWRTRGGRHRFRSKRGPVRRFILQGDPFPGEARIEARLGGTGLELPPMPLGRDLVVQVRASNGLCLGADFVGPDKDTTRRYQADCLERAQ